MTAPDASASNAPHAASQGGASLSRDLAELLIELSIALHKHAIYPEGHPLLASAEDRVSLRLRPLVEERGSLAIGVARRQLVIEGVATDPANALLRELAGKLHNNYLGAVRNWAAMQDEAECFFFLADLQRIAVSVGLVEPQGSLETDLHPHGYRLLEGIKSMPRAVANRLVRQFDGLQSLMAANLEDLKAVEGIGEQRARTVRESLSRMAETSLLERFM